MSIPEPDPGPLRPRDLALLQLAAPSDSPRLRARDQAADRLGDALLRSLLDRLVALDPDPADLEAALNAIAADLGGPARSLAALWLHDWAAFASAPASLPWLLDQALTPPPPRKRDRR